MPSLYPHVHMSNLIKSHEADDTNAALALFRMRRLPTLTQMQLQGSVPTEAVGLQTDSRECVMNSEAKVCQLDLGSLHSRRDSR